jgi:hypothetical protein
MYLGVRLKGASTSYARLTSSSSAAASATAAARSRHRSFADMFFWRETLVRRCAAVRLCSHGGGGGGAAGLGARVDVSAVVRA